MALVPAPAAVCLELHAFIALSYPDSRNDSDTLTGAHLYPSAHLVEHTQSNNHPITYGFTYTIDGRLPAAAGRDTGIP